ILDVPGGTVAASVDDDHVCTCGGPTPKCIRWAGNGSPVDLTYNDVSGTWEGEESVDGVSGSADGICEPGLPTGTATIPIALSIGLVEGECTWEAARTLPYCQVAVLD